MPPVTGIAAMAAFTFAPMSAPGILRGSIIPPEAVPFDAGCAKAAVASGKKQVASAQQSFLML